MGAFDATGTTQKPKILMLRTHAQTAGVSLTAQQAHNNIVRGSPRNGGRAGRDHPPDTNSMDETSPCRPTRPS